MLVRPEQEIVIESAELMDINCGGQLEQRFDQLLENFDSSQNWYSGNYQSQPNDREFQSYRAHRYREGKETSRSSSWQELERDVSEKILRRKVIRPQQLELHRRAKSQYTNFSFLYKIPTGPKRNRSNLNQLGNDPGSKDKFLLISEQEQKEILDRVRSRSHSKRKDRHWELRDPEFCETNDLPADDLFVTLGTDDANRTPLETERTELLDANAESDVAEPAEVKLQRRKKKVKKVKTLKTVETQAWKGEPIRKDTSNPEEYLKYLHEKIGELRDRHHRVGERADPKAATKKKSKKPKASSKSETRFTTDALRGSFGCGQDCHGL